MRMGLHTNLHGTCVPRVRVPARTPQASHSWASQACTCTPEVAVVAAAAAPGAAAASVAAAQRWCRASVCPSHTRTHAHALAHKQTAHNVHTHARTAHTAPSEGARGTRVCVCPSHTHAHGPHGPQRTAPHSRVQSTRIKANSWGTKNNSIGTPQQQRLEPSECARGTRVCQGRTWGHAAHRISR
jgi:hypothetical protein